MRADAAAIDDDPDDDAPVYRSRRPAADDGIHATSHVPSQVYSIRVPVDRLEQVRRLASERNIAPTTMLRQWVLAQLDRELGAEPPGSGSGTSEPGGTKPPQPAPRQRRDGGAERLEAVTTALAEVATNLTRTASLMAEMMAHQNSAVASGATRVHPLPYAPVTPLAAAASPFLMGTGQARPALGYVGQGLAALQTTIEHTASMPGVAGRDLSSLYAAADEELST
ncbi:MAG TPA: hypothetical protein VKG80_15465 [Trebonia sp.]|nr:hypothetical protein [Trebonia sp.]